MTYSSFYDQILIGIYSYAARSGGKPASVRGVMSEQGIAASSHYLSRLYKDLSYGGLADFLKDNDDPENFYAELTGPGLREAERLLAQTLAPEPNVPAADRVVKLDHNQVQQAEKPISELVAALERDNGDPHQPGLRERLLGEIKAGRELVRVGEFRALLLYETLVRALGELIKRYKNPAIVVLAEALLGAVVSQMMQGK